MLKNNSSRNVTLIGWTCFFLLLIALSTFVVGSKFIANASNGEGDESLSVRELTINDIAISVVGTHQEGEYFQVDVCYSLPDDRDWILTSRPDDAVLRVDGQPYTIREEGVSDLKFNSDGIASEKCQYMLFPVEVKNGANLVLSLKKIYVSEPDKVDCPALQKQLDELKSNIRVTCPTEANVGGFGVTQKPSSMDSDTAQEFALDVLTDARRGPWVFHFQFTQP
jgi:hypothetical protein